MIFHYQPRNADNCRWTVISKLLYLLTIVLLTVNSKSQNEKNSTDSVTRKADVLGSNYWRHLNKRCANEATNGSDKCIHAEDELVGDDPFNFPQFQAPVDICSNGMPLTKLGAPIICDPLTISCPDGYKCVMHARTRSSYCCGVTHNEAVHDSTKALCPNGQITYFEQSDGTLRKCELSRQDSCPSGYICTPISSSVNRCCGMQFGCPQKSIALINGRTSAYVRCSHTSTGKGSCPFRFQCVKSETLGIPICCVDHNSQRKSPCLVGVPSTNGPILLNESSCQQGYQITKSGDHYYCCPAADRVCALPLNDGTICHDHTMSSTVRFYFDSVSGSCRSFSDTQCDANDNNFVTLRHCQEFCQPSQCTTGIAQRSRNANTVCSIGIPNACEPGYKCSKPAFGRNHICCPEPIKICEEVVTAGTDCFDKSLSIIRFYYDQVTKNCQSFEYFGCSANSNNFLTRDQCVKTCKTDNNDGCDGAAPFADISGRVQRCLDNSQCPKGYTCGVGKLCCPIPAFACASPIDAGYECRSHVSRREWVYDQDSQSCRKFHDIGCGGNANRFSDKRSCETMCLRPKNNIECPRGMIPRVLEGQIQTCSASASDCPEQHSCIQAEAGLAICCRNTARCPNNLNPAVIPGSDSMISCLATTDKCPSGSECLESSLNGYFLCCESQQNTVYHLQRAQSIHKEECPENIAPIGKTCAPNVVGQCPESHTCLKNSGRSFGFCCRSIPICIRGKTEFLSKGQARVCGTGYELCAKGSACLTSSVPSINVCCHLASELSPPRFFSSSPSSLCLNGKAPFYERGSRWPKQCLMMHSGQCPDQFACQPSQAGGLFYCCPISENECRNGEQAYIATDGNEITCDVNRNNCPLGYSCQPSFDVRRSLCCIDQVALAKCSIGTSAYIYGNRPLACPKGSNRCPNGYLCTQSSMQNVYLCCSSLNEQAAPSCVQGMPYIDPAYGTPKLCTPFDRYNCPPGYTCMESTFPNRFTCCTNRRMNPAYRGFCPMDLVPFITRMSPMPRTCHMVLQPCPNTAQFTCIYSVAKQNSFCCTPIETFLHPPLPSPHLRSIADTSGCPLGSHPLVNAIGESQSCNPEPCPSFFKCYVSSAFNRWQCCSEIRNTVHRKEVKSSAICESGYAMINGRCMQLLYIGQKGCEISEQCSMKLSEAFCEKNYCICPRNKLIHQSKCVTHCPDGFIDIAARCHDLTTIVFMDSVDNRKNGTIGGFCKSTIIENDQCVVENSFCNEKSVTCQCNPGFELQMNFGDPNDVGKCVKLEKSIFSVAIQHETDFSRKNEESVNILSSFNDKADDDNNSTMLNSDDDIEYIQSILFQLDS